MKKYRIFLIVLLVLCLFTGCNAPSEYGNQLGAPAAGGEGIYDASEKNESSEIVGRKLIRTITIEAETKDLDGLLSDLDAQLTALGGYVQNKQVRGSTATGSRRSASLTLRIPADKLDQFVNHVTDATNILSSGETTEDVTLKFIATESRIAALEAEEARVMELIAKAENLGELLTLESKLSDIRQELEEVKSQLKLYENLVDYGTVYLRISEEEEYTVTDTEKPTVWQRIGTGFVKSLTGVGNIFTELFVFFVVASPYLAILTGIIILCVVLGRRRKRKIQMQQEQQNP